MVTYTDMLGTVVQEGGGGVPGCVPGWVYRARVVPPVPHLGYTAARRHPPGGTGDRCTAARLREGHRRAQARS